MSLYARAWLFTGWIFFLFFTMNFWLFWPVERWGEAAGIPGMLIWLGHGAATLILFPCPQCGCSAFASHKGLFALHRPWPSRRCGECGHDLRAGAPGRDGG